MDEMHDDGLTWGGRGLNECWGGAITNIRVGVYGVKAQLIIRQKVSMYLCGYVTMLTQFSHSYPNMQRVSFHIPKNKTKKTKK